MTKTFAVTSLAVLSIASLGLSGLPASADDDRNGRYGIGKAQAIDTAIWAGVDRIEEIERDDDEWEIEGWTYDGCEIELEIHARSGEILEREIDDCDDRHEGRYDDDDDDDYDDDDD